MKRWYIHGTSYESMINIQKEGFKQSNRIWTCSEYETLYLRRLCESGLEEELLEPEEQFIETIHATLFNACIAAAFQNSKDSRIALLFLNLDDEEVSKDNSCPGMEECYQIPYKALEGKELLSTTLEVYDPQFRLSFLPFENPTFNIDECELSTNELLWLSIHSSSDSFDEELIAQAMEFNKAKLEAMKEQFVKCERTDENDKI